MLHYIVFSVPTVVVTLLFGFLPWGLSTAIATPIIMVATAGLIPRRRVIQMNVQTALEGLSYGCLSDAQEHISAALREAEDTKALDRSDLEILVTACDKVAQSLTLHDQPELAQTIRDRCAKLKARAL